MTLQVYAPSDGSLIATLEMDSTQTLRQKIEKAHAAQPAWEAMGVKKRASIMHRYLEHLKAHASELAALVSEENGKTPAEAQAEVDKAIEVTEFACALPQIMVNQNLEVSRGVQCTMAYKPMGVVASITPFNFPVMIPHWTVPIALTCGNAMLVKLSEKVPLSGVKMIEWMHAAGVPVDIVQSVLGEKEMVEAICEASQIKAVSFVGSTPIAKIVYRKASDQLKRALCLGGAKNHLLVLPDANKDMTAQNVVASMAGMAGQRCMAASVMVAVGDCEAVIAQIVEEAKKLVPGQNLGAIISKESKERIERYIGDAEKSGCQVLLDGRGAVVAGKEGGNYVAPTVIDQVPKGHPVGCDEIFGPVLSIIRARTVDEAIEIQNSSPYGNGASVYTSSGGHAQYVRERLNAGMIGTNIGVPVPREPFSFGGTKDSKFGVGDITGASSVEFWTRKVKYTTKWDAEHGVDWMS